MFLSAGAWWGDFADDRREVATYRHAPVCAVPYEDGPATCLERIPAFIESTEVTGPPWAREAEVRYRVDDAEVWTVEIERVSAELDALEPGKAVLVVAWGSWISRIEFLDGRVLETAESPVAIRSGSLRIALSISLVGLGLLVMGIRARRDTRSWWLPARPIPGRGALSTAVWLALLGGALTLLFAGQGIYDDGALLLRGATGLAAGGFLGGALYLRQGRSGRADSGR
ncbi:MAG TPA: hypothetical protein VGB03_04250 [Acidimicrobiales bacterium]|jgi:hypothetical protein